MEIPTLKSEIRKAAGSRAAARLRKAGRLPGIVYGHKIDPISVALDRHEVGLLLDRGTHLVNLDLGGQAQACLFKDAQYDHLGEELVHVDLARVDLNERVKVHVPIELRGTPKGAAEGGVLTGMLKELEIECLVTNIPDHVRVDVSGLALDQVLYVKDVPVVEGMTILNDAEAVVAMVRMPLEVAATPTEAPAEGASAEPEVIAKGKAEAEEGEAAE